MGQRLLPTYRWLPVVPCNCNCSMFKW